MWIVVPMVLRVLGEGGHLGLTESTLEVTVECSRVDLAPGLHGCLQQWLGLWAGEHEPAVGGTSRDIGRGLESI